MGAWGRVGWIALCACLVSGCADDEDLSGSADGGGGLPRSDFAVAGPEMGAPAGGGCQPGATRPCGDLCPGVRRCVDGEIGPCEAPPELCNGRDDDCDGALDEGFEGLGEPCTAGLGECLRHGTLRCAADGAAACDVRPGPRAAEACNGLDDDCDGAADEGPAGGPLQVPCYLGPPDTEGVGTCRAGARTCEAGALTPCDGVVPTPEACNGLDDDCDGRVDEDALGVGAPCAAGEGVCRAEGHTACVGGLAVCDAAPAEPGEEACNGLDDDCDGEIDELPEVGAPCQVGLGECARDGLLLCDAAAGALRCHGEAGLPGAEICNGLDDDCDGETDELPQVGARCTAGLGACARLGGLACDPASGALRCDAQPGPPGVEICNAVDDDCDGAVDDVAGRHGPCEVGVGACAAPGRLRCVPGQAALVCDAQPGAPSEEQCDGVDNDCDGRTDEGLNLPQGGEPCANGWGVCRRQGTLACIDGQERCDAEPGLPGVEICNGLDDDCDRAVDELPGTGEPCAVGVGACQREALTACDPQTGRIACGAQAGAPVPERCNGLDDDCDGVVDPAPVCQTFASCKAALAAGHTGSGVYRLQPGPALDVFEVWCDQATDGGGWTLVGSIARRALDDRRAGYYADLATLAPQGQDAGVWQGLRALDTRFDVRFACRASAGAASAPFTVDLSMYDTGWYTEWTTGSDAASCFSEGNGEGADPPPARRDNRTGQYLVKGTAWRAGYLEGEDQCDASQDFAVDFADRGMDGNPNDGTDWGEDDGELKCGRAGIADGQWFLFAREAGRLLRQGAYQVGDGPSWVGHRSMTCLSTCDALFGDATWACSRSGATPDRRAWLDGWGDVASFCGADSEGAPEAFAEPQAGLYDCGEAGCSYSAYVDDHGCDRQNHCWRRVAPLAFVPPAVGSGGSLGRLEGDGWRVCSASDATAWIAADREGIYAPTTTCRALGYAEVDAWGGHCGQVCGQCPGGPRYDGVGGNAVGLSGLVHWRCRR